MEKRTISRVIVFQIAVSVICAVLGIVIGMAIEIDEEKLPVEDQPTTFLIEDKNTEEIEEITPSILTSKTDAIPDETFSETSSSGTLSSEVPLTEDSVVKEVINTQDEYEQITEPTTEFRTLLEETISEIVSEMTEEAPLESTETAKQVETTIADFEKISLDPNLTVQDNKTNEEISSESFSGLTEKPPVNAKIMIEGDTNSEQTLKMTPSPPEDETSYPSSSLTTETFSTSEVESSEADDVASISGVSADDGESDKIINGEPAEEGTFTSVVSLQHVNNSQPFCGGTILNRDFVLTAAHCIFSKNGNDPIDFKIVSSNIDLTRETRTYWPVTIIIHAQYNKSIFLGYDIALIRIEPQFVLGNGEMAIFLPRQDEIIPAGTQATVVGWGRTDQRYMSDKVLRVLDESVIDNIECAERLDFKPSIYDFHLCAQPKPQTGFCRGDSGGPVFVGNTQIGVVSWYKGNCSNEEPLPNVFTRVAYFTDWIHQKIDEEVKILRRR